MSSGNEFRRLNRTAETLEAHVTSRPDDHERVSPDRDREGCERILAFLNDDEGRKETKHNIGVKADPRAIKKWLKKLEELRYITQTLDRVWAILYVSDNRRCEKLLGDL